MNGFFVGDAGDVEEQKLFVERPGDFIVADAIDKMQETLDRDFAQLGDLIQGQTQIIVDTVNRDGMAAALANSDVASARIQAFLSNGDKEALETAVTELIRGVQFFTELNLSSYADLLFFLPGLVKAGTIRVFVLASEPQSVREPTNVIVDNISSMANLLSTMIDTIKSTVDAAHTVNAKTRVVRCPLLPQISERAEPVQGGSFRDVIVVDGYYHEERGQILASFDASVEVDPCDRSYKPNPAALATAQKARAQGVGHELAFIGIPYFEQILQLWRNLIRVPTLFDLNGTWASGGVPGPVISVTGPSISVDMSAYKRPTASGMIVDNSDITVTFPDDKAYTAKLQLPNVILWSNTSAWTKA